MELTVKENILTNNDCYKSRRTITPIGMQLHTIGTGQNTASSLASYWNQSGIEACVHYCIDAEQENLIYHFLPDNYRSWADGGFGNGNLITVELMESDYMKYTGGANYTITDTTKFKSDITRAYKTAVQFFAQKCKQYGWNPTAKLSNGLYVISSHDEGRRLGVSTSHVDPTHVWNKLGFTMDQFRSDVKAVMAGTSAKEESTKITAASLSGLSEQQKIEKLVPLYVENMNQTGMLASVGIAQCILESGWATTDLALYANNMHGMKCSLSGNTWKGSVWDGKSRYTKRTSEQDKNGSVYYVTADFRKYPSIKESIADRSAYFIGATNGSGLRYPNVNKQSDYKKQITIIKNGGYATDINYISKICNIIERYGLNKYDTGYIPKEEPYVEWTCKVKKDNVPIRKGAGKNKKIVATVKKGTILTVIGEKKSSAGKIWYKVKSGNVSGYIYNGNVKKASYTVRVTADDLTIRSGAGTSYSKRGFTGWGTFTVVQEKKGSDGHIWGLLKAFEKNKDGWIAVDLNCVTRID